MKLTTPFRSLTLRNTSYPRNIKNNYLHLHCCISSPSGVVIWYLLIWRLVNGSATGHRLCQQRIWIDIDRQISEIVECNEVVWISFIVRGIIITNADKCKWAAYLVCRIFQACVSQISGVVTNSLPQIKKPIMLQQEVLGSRTYVMSVTAQKVIHLEDIHVSLFWFHAHTPVLGRMGRLPDT